MDKKYFVPYETAKLLKEKGYPEYADIFYDANGCLVNISARNNYDAPIVLPVIAAPTYHEVLDWLQGKGYPIESACVREYSDSDWMWICCVAYNATKPHFTHEEALNAAILKALKML